MTGRGSLEQLAALVHQPDLPCQREPMGAFELCVFDDGASHLRLNGWPETGELTRAGDREQRVDPQQRIAVERRLAALLSP